MTPATMHRASLFPAHALISAVPAAALRWCVSRPRCLHGKVSPEAPPAGGGALAAQAAGSHPSCHSAVLGLLPLRGRQQNAQLLHSHQPVFLVVPRVPEALLPAGQVVADASGASINIWEPPARTHPHAQGMGRGNQRLGCFTRSNISLCHPQSGVLMISPMTFFFFIEVRFI